MIPSNIVKQRTGLNQGRLSYLRKLGLIPPPIRIPALDRPGSTYVYPASIFTRIHVIEFLQSHGLTLTQIAQAARGTPFQCPPPAPPEEPANDN